MKYQTLVAAGLTMVLGAAPALSQVRADQIREHMEVKGSDGAHVGTVDKVGGSDIVLTKNDPASGGEHHQLPVSSVASVSANDVMLKMSAKDAMSEWKAESRPAGDRKH